MTVLGSSTAPYPLIFLVESHFDEPWRIYLFLQYIMLAELKARGIKIPKLICLMYILGFKKPSNQK